MRGKRHADKAYVDLLYSSGYLVHLVAARNGPIAARPSLRWLHRADRRISRSDAGPSSPRYQCKYHRDVSRRRLKPGLAVPASVGAYLGGGKPTPIIGCPDRPDTWGPQRGCGGQCDPVVDSASRRKRRTVSALRRVASTAALLDAPIDFRFRLEGKPAVGSGSGLRARRIQGR